MQAGYFSTAWREIRSTPNWVGKMFLLALVMCIPVFGPIVVYGYFYGWARDIAWGIQEPMPGHIFGNEDGKLYSRGFFILVLVVVCACIPGIINGIGGAISGIGAASSVGYYYASPNYGSLVIFTILGGLISLIGFVAVLLISFFQWVGSVRISIYGRISAGFQVKKIWAMLRKDTPGILRIFGMALLVSLIVGIIIGIVVTIVAGVAVFSSISTIMGIAGGSGDYSRLFWYGLGAGGISLLILVIVFYLALVVEMWVMALVANALGHWTRQFDVPAWRGQEDPMPFEVQQAAAKAAQAPQQPSYPQTPPAASPQQQQQPYTPPVAPQYQQPYQAPSAAPQPPYQQPMPQQQPYQSPAASPQQPPYQQQPSYPQTPPAAAAPQEAPSASAPAPQQTPVPPAAGTVPQEPAATTPTEAPQAASAPAAPAPEPQQAPPAASGDGASQAAPAPAPEPQQEPPATPGDTPQEPPANA